MRFGLFRPEYSGSPLEAAHLGYFGLNIPTEFSLFQAQKTVRFFYFFVRCLLRCALTEEEFEKGMKNGEGHFS